MRVCGCIVYMSPLSMVINITHNIAAAHHQPLAWAASFRVFKQPVCFCLNMLGYICYWQCFCYIIITDFRCVKCCLNVSLLFVVCKLCGKYNCRGKHEICFFVYNHMKCYSTTHPVMVNRGFI